LGVRFQKNRRRRRSLRLALLQDLVGQLGPPLPRCVGGGRSYGHAPFVPEWHSGVGLGLPLEQRNPPDIAGVGKRLTGISQARSGRQTGPGDSILALRREWPVADPRRYGWSNGCLEQQRRSRPGKRRCSNDRQDRDLAPSSSTSISNWASAPPLFIQLSAVVGESYRSI